MPLAVEADPRARQRLDGEDAHAWLVELQRRRERIVGQRRRAE
jgi:hypothetical protein